MRGLIRVLPDAAALAATAAEEFAAALRASPRPFHAALSGGSTPRATHEKLAAIPALPWRRVRLFWGDERCVPPDDADSNFGMARETLLSRASIPERGVFRVPTERAPADAAAAYAETIRRELGPAPRFDWIFLGLGPDGHTASLFPGTSVVREKSALTAAVWVESKKSHRVTLTLPVLNAARRVVFVVSGADKAEVVRRVLEDAPGEDAPASLVRPEGGARWLLDAAAASRLTPGRGS